MYLEKRVDYVLDPENYWSADGFGDWVSTLNANVNLGIRHASRPSAKQDAEDISQEVLIHLTGKITDFQHNGSPGAFRSWMRRITLNVMRNFLRARATKPLANDEPVVKVLEQMEDPDSDLTQEFQRQHNMFVLKRLLDSVKTKFAPENLELFRRYCIAGEDPSVLECFCSDIRLVPVAKHRVRAAYRDVTD